MEESADLKFDIKSRMATLLDYVFEDGASFRDDLADLLDAPDRNASPRLYLDGTRVSQCDRLLWRALLTDPIVALPACEEALNEALSDVDRFPEASKKLEAGTKVSIGLVGEFGSHLVSPRSLSSSRVNGVVCIVGIVTRATTVRPKVVQSVHYCEATKEYLKREYRDVTSHLGAPTSAVYPTRDEAGNLLETEYGYCRYVNAHTISMQELPELSPPGMLPRAVEVILEDDLADGCKPGDRVYVTGVLKPIVPRTGSQIRSQLKSVVVANAIRQTSTAMQCGMTMDDVRRIKSIASGDDPLNRLAASFAPTIYGHHLVKKGILLLMFGGEEKNLETGTHLRGDINCLLVGDPGTAKSQLLRAAMEVCPSSISTTGRGSTGVGLTAAVTMDADTGEKRLEAGAMVLADRGIVCIDEFDKMSDADRVAIHEVMEQQTVTITKSGIKASLNARCSVLAAANPLYGSYDHDIPIAKNVNLPDSLLSRFDLLFVILDERSRQHDQHIAKFILDRHMEPSGEVGGRALSTVHSWHYLQATHQATDKSIDGTLDPELLRKYIVYAKQHGSGNIQLSELAMKAISEAYVQLRASAMERALPITPRTLETMVRLSTAHAKLRLSQFVEIGDVEAIKEIMDVVLGTQGVYTRDTIEQPSCPIQDADNMEIAHDDAPTIQSFIPAKPSHQDAPDPDSMEIDTVDALTHDQKRSVHLSIGEALDDKPYSSIDELHQLLKTKGLTINAQALSDYVAWIADNYEAMPQLHLPQILFDVNTQEFFDVS